MSKKKSRKGHKRFHIWWATLAASIICFVLAIVMYIELFNAIMTLDPNDSGNILGIIFGMIGAYAGIAGIYSMYAGIFLWIGIIALISTIVLAILERKKK